MTHVQYQEQISQFVDSDLREENSSALFTHLAECHDCREFMQSLLKLRSGLMADSLTIPALIDRKLNKQFSSAAVSPSSSRSSLWRRQVTMRVPVVAFLLCLIIAGAVLVFSGRSPFYEPEMVYVTRLPAVVITNGTESVQPKN